MSNYNPRGGYENRSLLKEAIANRLVREFELESLYKSPEVAAVEVMHKYDGTRQDMAWVLMGDSIAKSGQVYAFIDNVIKAAGQGLQGLPSTMTGAPNAQGQPTQSHMQGGEGGNILGLGDNWQEEATGRKGLSGGASQQTAGGNQQSHAPKQGLGSRFKNWAKNSAAPALGRGLRHAGAFMAGGGAGGPLGALAATGASMAQAHKGKQSGQYNKVLGGQEGLGQIAGDAAKQGMVGVKNAAGQQAQNFQTGQGAMGKVGQAAMAGKNMASSAWQGLKNLGSNMVSGAKNAVQQAGQQQQANLQQQNPDLARQQARAAGGEQAVQQQQAQNMMPPGPMNPPEGAPPGNMQTHPPAGGTPQAQPQQPETAQVDQTAVDEIAQNQGPQAPAQPALGAGGGGMFGGQTQGANNSLDQIKNASNDAYSSIQDILKGW